jgi:hypothetical protein
LRPTGATGSGANKEAEQEPHLAEINQRSSQLDETPATNLSIDHLIRHETEKLLRAGPPGRFLCLSCLEKTLRTALGAADTKGRVERALRGGIMHSGSVDR